MAEVLDRNNFLDNVGDELDQFAYIQSWNRLNQFGNTALTPEILNLFDSPDETLVLAGSIGADIRSVYEPILEMRDRKSSHIRIGSDFNSLVMHRLKDRRVYCGLQNQRPDKLTYTLIGAYIPTAKGIIFKSSESIKATDIYKGAPRTIKPLNQYGVERTAQAQKDYINVLHQLTRLVTQHVKSR